VRKVAGSIGTTRSDPPTGSETPVGNVNVMPFVNFHVLVGFCTS
jgi:hypothetical protein